MIDRTKTSYWLIGLGATLVTCVCSDSHHRFDLSGAGHYSSNRHQITDAVSSYITDHFGFIGGGWFEIKLTVDGRYKCSEKGTQTLNTHEIYIKTFH